MLLGRVGWTHVRTVAGFPIVGCSVLSLCLQFIFSAPLSAAPPFIAALENNYSYISPGSPNYGIAQGSLFIISETIWRIRPPVPCLHMLRARQRWNICSPICRLEAMPPEDHGTIYGYETIQQP
jgi:hypothetical protein